MQSRMGIALTVIAALGLAAQSGAGTYFRLEIGPPVAAGANTKMKKAVLVVRPRLCDDEAGVRITGTAEGMVKGERQSVRLTLVALPAPGVHAVQRQWPEDGQWVLHLKGTCPATGAASSTIVPLTKEGFDRSKTQVLRDIAKPAQVEAVLRALPRAGP